MGKLKERDQATLLLLNLSSLIDQIGPTCGKWQNGGIEASEKGIGHLSDENNLELQPTPIEGFGKVYANADESIQIYNGDLFEFSRKLFKEDIKIGAIIDKGSLVALPPDLRAKYLHVMAEFAQDSNCRYLMCLYEHNM